MTFLPPARDLIRNCSWPYVPPVAGSKRSPSGSAEAGPAPIDGSFATAYHAEPIPTGGALSERTATAAPGCPRRTFSHSGRTGNPTSNTSRTTAEPAHPQSGSGSSLQVPFRSPNSGELMSTTDVTVPPTLASPLASPSRVVDALANHRDRLGCP